LIQDLENDFVQGTNKYPTTIVKAYDVLNLWRHNPSYLMKSLGGYADGILFVQTGRNGSGIVCYRCGRPGHIAPKCTHDTHTDGHALTGATMTQGAGGDRSNDNDEGDEGGEEHPPQPPMGVTIMPNLGPTCS